MDKIETTQILKNLNTALAHAKDRFTHEFIMQEVILNDTFKISFRNYLFAKDCNVEYFDKTTVVKNSTGQQIYIANQWFAIASYFVDFCTEMLTYRALFVKICKLMGMDAKTMKEYATRLKTLSTEEDKVSFVNVAMQMLKNDFPGREDEYKNVAGYLWKFASDYKWWAGNKTIDRHDFYISALLNQMNVVNNNSEFLAIIVNSYASNLKLRLLAENVENFTIGIKVNTYKYYDEVQQDEGFVSDSPLYINETPKKNAGISISAASLERFQSKGL
ncbi:hypothetical protein I6E12_11815 [Prevotella brevis]|uniref:Uncharacterized protein n=1 Tax=Xylanibacter brevis TaxID=83231 RepID=A0ABS9CKE0_9BACT|nr:hypothetical protein [Xylanibacter brevis]MCF2564782.1 hypothetical protein [Xylanibacter brevis]